MNLYKNILCVLLSGMMVISLASCANGENPKKETVSKKPVQSLETTTSVEDTTNSEDATSLENTVSTNSETSSKDDNYSESTVVDKKPTFSNTSSHRKEYVAKEEKEEKFVDKDGEFAYKSVNWDGPNGYVIVIPKENEDAKKTAEKLRDFFVSQSGVELSIVEDTTKETKKEILIGKTNRTQSNTKLPEEKLEVAIKGGKLVFSGGHEVTVDSAVQKFIRLAPKKGKAYTFSVTTDFVSTALKDYKYVWGDEFEGNGIDLKKWFFNTGAMSSTKKIQTSYDKDVIDVQDGRLKMHAFRVFNPQREGTQYKVNHTLSTKVTMNWLYGYVEIRARVPFMKGAWPGYWACSASDLSGIAHENVVAEIDMFEVFGNTNTLYSNLHKHTKGVGSVQINNIKEWNEKSAYKFENSKELSNEYHTYGMLWTPTEISMFIDGKKYVTYDITKAFDDTGDMSMFNMPIDIMFNNFVMTEETGMKTSMIWESLDKLPVCFYVDYIRIYQKPDEGKIWTAESTYTYPDRK